MNSSKNQSLYQSDMSRYNNNLSDVYLKHFFWCFRHSQVERNVFLKFCYKVLLKFLKNKRGLEIFSETRIGPGLYLGHPWNITINPDVIIGKNVNIHKGVTIGQENRGKRKGTPTIGDSVWIGVNATIVGRITIGNDVLIAPNSYVNCDIPSHSIVFGNPCIIKYSFNATEGYITNKI